MFFDTHTHMDAEQFHDDRNAAIQRAFDAGVSYFLNVGFDDKTIPTTLTLANKYEQVYAAIGYHPHFAVHVTERHLIELEQLLLKEKQNKVRALGEIGLDYYYDYPPHIQQNVFREQIRMAKRVKLPIIIHNRDAHADVLKIMREEHAEDVGGILHCYSGSYEMAEQFMALGFYISLGGPVTYKNAKQPIENATKIRLDRLLIETDSPYLTPHPHRGKRNETSYVTYVAQTIAQLKNISLEELAKITTENAKKVFNIG